MKASPRLVALSCALASVLACDGETPKEPLTVGGEKIPSKHASLSPGRPGPSVDPKDGMGPHGAHGTTGRSVIQTLDKAAVILKVDGQAFTRGDLDRTLYQAAANAGVPPEMIDPQMRDAFEEPAYEKLIERTLLVKEAKRRNLWPSDEEAKQATEDMLKTLPPGKTLNDVLVQLGVDEASFREDVRIDVAIAKLLKAIEAEMPPPSDEIVTKIYEANKQVFTIPDTASASHILVKVDRGAGKQLIEAKKKEALAIKALVVGKDAATFARVAAEKSEDPSGKMRGGDLGAFQRGDLMPELEELAFKLKDGEVGGPVQTNRGWHVVRGGGVTKGRVVPLAEAKAVIAEREKVKSFMQRVDDTIASLRNAAQIERVVPPLPSPLTEKGDGSKVSTWRASAKNALPGMRNPHADVPAGAPPAAP